MYLNFLFVTAVVLSCVNKAACSGPDDWWEGSTTNSSSASNAACFERVASCDGSTTNSSPNLSLNSSLSSEAEKKEVKDLEALNITTKIEKLYDEISPIYVGLIFEYLKNQETMRIQDPQLSNPNVDKIKKIIEKCKFNSILEIQNMLFGEKIDNTLNKNSSEYDESINALVHDKKENSLVGGNEKSPVDDDDESINELVHDKEKNLSIGGNEKSQVDDDDDDDIFKMD